MREKRTYPFTEGECVALGLPSGGYALIVVARVSRRKQLMLVYAFAPRYATLPSLDEVIAKLQPEQAILTAMVDLYKIQECMAQVPPVHHLGQLPHWKREDWPVSPRIMIVSSEPQPFLIEYDDHTLESLGWVPYPVEQLIGGRYLSIGFVVFDAFVRSMDVRVDNPPDPDEWVQDFYRRRQEAEEFRRRVLERAKREREEAMMSEADEQALRQALEAGLDPHTPQPFEHYLYFGTRRRAEQAAAALRQAGYTVAVDRSAGGSEWLVLARHMLLADEEALDRAIEFLEDLASRYGGEYDGWGVAVASESEGS